MKKINGKKLALNRETLASLSPDALDGVNGGQQLPGTGISPQLTRPITKYICPRVSQLVCPPSRNVACAGAGNGGGAEGQG